MSKDLTPIELILISAICFTLGFVIFFRGSDEPQSVISEPSMEDFDFFPLQAWQTTDKDGGEAIKIKYKVEDENTRLYMINTKGKVVHKQPISLDPFRDGRERIETYVWKLYRTEWTAQIAPGEYQIIVGTDYDKSTTRNYHMEIDVQ
jgi:hypothetical protein|tara:strand:+ start:318 stop:761 length:444 start_codon:yes stop_codon:yes gene_type:complete